MAGATLEMPGILTIICDYFHIFITVIYGINKGSLKR